MERLEGVRRLAAVWLAAAVLPFCGGEAVDTGSSESHFLTPCQATCESGLSCVCGVCTKMCDGDEVCTELESGSTCLPVSNAESCDTGGNDAVCDVECTDDASCRRLGDGYRCDAGRCRPPATCTGAGCGVDGGDGLTCEERENQASQAVQDAIATADPSCETSADCVVVSNSSDCHYACGVVLSTRGGASLQAVIDTLNAGVCADFLDAGCMALIPPCPAPPGAACVAGQCTQTFFADLGAPCSASCSTGECYEPGTGVNPICSRQCTVDDDCGPGGLCQTSGGTGKWCFRRCDSDAECRSVNTDTQNALFCTVRIDPNSSSGYGGPYQGVGDGFCIQSSEP